MKYAKVRQRLEKALDSGRMVRVWRDAYDSEFTDGIVVALTSKWVVLHGVVDGVYLDSLVLMRLRDIDTVRDGHNAYIARAMSALGEPIGVFNCAADATTRDLLKTAVDLHPLASFALGDEGEEQLMIGRLLKCGQKRFRHRFLRPDGTWSDDVDHWNYSQVSSIHIGGRYIDALAQFGDPCPDTGPGGLSTFQGP